MERTAVIVTLPPMVVLGSDRLATSRARHDIVPTKRLVTGSGAGPGARDALSSEDEPMAATIIYGARETEVPSAVARDAGELWLTIGDLRTATGWEVKPQGLCLADACVPLPADRNAAWLDDAGGRFNLSAFARHLEQPVVRDDAHAVWAFGEPVRASALEADEAPDFRLPDLDGRPHSLSEYRGKKVLLYCWASW
jgi:hypothetical protein